MDFNQTTKERNYPYKVVKEKDLKDNHHKTVENYIEDWKMDTHSTKDKQEDTTWDSLES